MVGLVDDFGTGKLGPEHEKMAYDATKEVLRSPGLLSGGQMSVQIGKMTVVGQQIVNPVVMQVLQQVLCKKDLLPETDEPVYLEGTIVDKE
jgi:hypothetical protein